MKIDIIYYARSGRYKTCRYHIKFIYRISIKFVSHILDLVLVAKGLVGFV